MNTQSAEKTLAAIRALVGVPATPAADADSDAGLLLDWLEANGDSPVAPRKRGDDYYVGKQKIGPDLRRAIRAAMQLEIL